MISLGDIDVTAVWQAGTWWHAGVALTALGSFTHNTTLSPATLSHTHHSLTHNIVTHTPLSHTTLSHIILSHHTSFTPNSFTYNSFTYNCHAQLRHTLLFHTICLPPCPFFFLPFPSHVHICLVLVGRSWHVGLSGSWIVLPVVPHKAAAEVSKIGWQSESTDGPAVVTSTTTDGLLDVVWCSVVWCSVVVVCCSCSWTSGSGSCNCSWSRSCSCSCCCRVASVQKWSEHVVFLAFWHGHVLCATTAIWTAKSAPNPTVFHRVLTSKCASRHNGMQCFISHVPRWLRTRRFSEPTFRASRAKFCDFSFFLRASSFFWPFLFFDLLFSSFLFSDSSHLCFSISPYCRKFDF